MHDCMSACKELSETISSQPPTSPSRCGHRTCLYTSLQNKSNPLGGIPFWRLCLTFPAAVSDGTEGWMEKNVDMNRKENSNLHQIKDHEP